MMQDILNLTQLKKSNIVSCSSWSATYKAFIVTMTGTFKKRSFNVGDLVLRRIQDETGQHKLNSRWEGPFIVLKDSRPGSYRLQYSDGQEVANFWNIEHLHRFYP
jgi:hypothetical protein